MQNYTKRVSHRMQQARPWLLMLTLIGMLILGQTASPILASSSQQTIPDPAEPNPLPPDLPTVLVGPIDTISLDARTLVVAGVPITITDDTRISGRVGDLSEVGWARVVGQADGAGGIVADRIKGIRAKPFMKLRGQLDELTDTSLSVNAIGLNRTETTLLVGDPQPGDRVKVRAAIESTGDRLALQVHKLGAKPSNPDDDEQNDDSGELDDVEENQRTRLIGVVQSMPDTGLIGEWTVSTIRVKVTTDTKVSRLHKLLTEEAWVKVEGEMNSEGVLEAKRLRVIRTRHYHKLGGILDSMNDAEIVVNGIPVQLGDDLRTKGNPQVGEWVHVYMTLGEDDVLTAVKLIGRHNHDNKPEPEQPVGDVISFTGIVNELPIGGLFGEWKVNGVIINVPESAVIDEHKGAVSVGSIVSVKALVEINNGASFTALEIAVVQPGGSTTLPPQEDEEGEFTEFKGVVEALPGGENSGPGGASWDGGEYVGEWTVSGRTVHVTEQTRVEDHGGIQVGDEVEVKGYELSDGSIRAVKIESEGEHEGGGDDDERPHRKEFMGKIVSFPEDLVGEWNVSEFKFMTDAETVFIQEKTEFAQGAKVMVWVEKGSDGVWTAYKVEALRAPEAETVRMDGRIVSMPENRIGKWEIAVRSHTRTDEPETTVVVTTTEETLFWGSEGSFAVDAKVRVYGEKQADGSVIATKMQAVE